MGWLPGSSPTTASWRDVSRGLPLVLFLMLYAVPVLYAPERVPPAIRPVLDLNPMTHLIVSYQEILFFDGPVGHWKWLLLVGALSTLLFLAGYWLFDRLRDSFAELV